LDWFGVSLRIVLNLPFLPVFCVAGGVFIGRILRTENLESTRLSEYNPVTGGTDAVCKGSICA